VQDSNLRKHTPTDLRSDNANWLSCGFSVGGPDFRSSSPPNAPRAPPP
jgi:hypothetical protein